MQLVEGRPIQFFTYVPPHMFKPRIIIGLVLIGQAFGADSAAKESPELIALKAAYQNQIEATNARYRERLTELMKKETQKGNLDGALAAREELAKLNKGVATPDAKSSTEEGNAIPAKDSPYYATKWRRNEGTLEFSADGTYRHLYKNESIAGQWKSTKQPGVVSLTNWPNRPNIQFKLIRNGTACSRSSDGFEYEKVELDKDGKENPSAKPSGGEKTSPFGKDY